MPHVELIRGFISICFRKFLSQLRHRGIGSSSAVRSMNSYTSGILTSLRESALLPGLLQQCSIRKIFTIFLPLHPRIIHFNQANGAVCRSLVCVAIRRGNETLALGSGTIIRPDGIVAASASPLSLLKIKELKVNVMVMGTEKIYEDVLLDADFCSNIALLKMLSPQQHDVPKFGHLDYLFQGLKVVAAGCDRHCGDLRYAEAGYSLGAFRSVANKVEKAVSHARTSGQIIKAKLDGIAPFIGGPLLDPLAGVYGVIHKEVCGRIEATLMGDIFEYLDRFEKHGEHPTSVSCGFGAIPKEESPVL
ncbi:hypothetical protein Vadar_014491 [Vaccinium darrowii]|uniref:Uncharacterized protein n=1 Tax=Vaccinium darrowii TaxID=229202 RepID=A0ACB7X9J2_9ERIC|nr:hypothetical protein Vadar_014491 [Vaccinium darrowii]